MPDPNEERMKSYFRVGSRKNLTPKSAGKQEPNVVVLETEIVIIRYTRRSDRGRDRIIRITT